MGPVRSGLLVAGACALAVGIYGLTLYDSPQQASSQRPPMPAPIARDLPVVTDGDDADEAEWEREAQRQHEADVDPASEPSESDPSAPPTDGPPTLRPRPGDRELSWDADAKSNARNLVSHMESCYVASQDYARCDTATELGETGLSLGSGAGQVEVASATATGYTIEARSRSGNVFRVVRSTRGEVTRSCARAGRAGCNSGGNW